jgi:hypothetical protein
MVDKITKTLWRGHRRRLEGQITEYAGLIRAIEGRLLRMRGRLKRSTGDAQLRLAAAIEQLESDYKKLTEGWQAILRGLDTTFTSGRDLARDAIERADAAVAGGKGLFTHAARALRKARVEAAALRKGVEVGLRRGRRMAAVANRRRAGRAESRTNPDLESPQETGQ